MSVYRPKDRFGKASDVYRYDFEFRGRRYAGTTGATTEREALRFERAERLRVRKEAESLATRKAPVMTFGQASTAYLDEVLKNTVTSSVESMLIWLQENVGNETPVDTIDAAFVTRLHVRKRATAKGRKGKPVSDTTLNRNVTEPLGRILRYVAKAHHQSLPEVDWASLRKREPEERISELTAAQEVRLFQVLRDDYKPIVRFAMTSGLRLAELCRMRWRDIDHGNRRIHVLGKGNKKAYIPMPGPLWAILDPLQGHHEEFVFTFLARKSSNNFVGPGVVYVRGRRYPMSPGGVKDVFRAYADLAGLHEFVFHDLRHTALSRIVRATKDLTAAQRIARHKRLATTMRYTHVLDEDVFKAMEAGALSSAPTNAPIGSRDDESPTNSPTKPAEESVSD